MIQCYKKPVVIQIGEDAGKTAYYAAFSRKGTADTIALSEEMKEGSSSFTKGEVVGVTLDLPARIKSALLAGQAVKINGLGVFKPSLTVDKVQTDPDKLTASAISIKSLNFTPDSTLLSDLNEQAVYQWISADKASDEDTDGTSSGGTTDSGSQSGGSGTSDSGDEGHD